MARGDIDEIMEKLNFNKDRDPLITTGHSIMIDSYNG